MNLHELLPTDGEFGWIIADSLSGQIIASHQPKESFPLASSAKLAIGAIVVLAVLAGECSWDSTIADVHFDPNEDSHLLYPHLQGRTEHPLRDVVEVMLACHDHHCSHAIAQHFSGWEEIHKRVVSQYPHIFIDQNKCSEENNRGRLDDLCRLLLDIAIGYRLHPAVWQPLISGLVRQQDKNHLLPPHELFNITGGLPHCMIDLGLVRNFASPQQLVYVIAGKHLPDRSQSHAADESAMKILHTCYAATEALNEKKHMRKYSNE